MGKFSLSFLAMVREPSPFCGCFGGIRLLSRSRLLSSFLASCLSVFVGYLSNFIVPGTTVALGPAVEKLGLRYEPIMEWSCEVVRVTGRIVEASESDSSPSLPDSSIGFSGSESGSASRSWAIEACATGDLPCMMPVCSYDRLRVCQSLPGLKGRGFSGSGTRWLDMLLLISLRT